MRTGSLLFLKYRCPRKSKGNATHTARQYGARKDNTYGISAYESVPWESGVRIGNRAAAAPHVVGSS